MFNLGMSELIVIGIIALIFIGPKQLPEVARVVGRLLSELKRATGDLTGTFVQARDQADEAIRRSRDRFVEEVNNVVENKPAGSAAGAADDQDNDKDKNS
jgi:sec-independent protein translocase protein TatB